MRERTWMSNDPKDPRWRFRVTEAIDETGLVEIVEEELTSTSTDAQVTEVTERLIMTPEQAEWMARTLTELTKRRRGRSG